MDENLIMEKANIIERICQLGDILQGTVVYRRHQCGKPNCRCKTNDIYRHSSRQLTFSHEGKTRTITIPKSKADEVTEGLNQYKEFRALVKRLLEINRLFIKKKTHQPMQKEPIKQEGKIMPGPKSPFKIQVSEKDKQELEAWLRKTTINQALARRARIILLISEDTTISEISRQVGVGRKVIRKWLKRFIEFGISGLYDLPRSGRPPEFSP